MSLKDCYTPRQLAIAVIDVCRDGGWPLTRVISEIGREGRIILGHLKQDSEKHPGDYTVDELNWITATADEVLELHG